MAKVDVELELWDVINFIMVDATPRELEKLKKIFLEKVDDVLIPNNLYDREKILLFKEAMDRYSLEQLREKLK